MNLNKQVRSYIEFELKHYPQTKKELEQLRNSIIEESGQADETGIRGSGTGDPTSKKALRLMTNVRLKRMEETVMAIENVMYELDEDKHKLLDLKYWTKRNLLTDIGIADQLGVGIATYYRWKDAIVSCVAREMGLS